MRGTLALELEWSPIIEHAEYQVHWVLRVVRNELSKCQVLQIRVGSGKTESVSNRRAVTLPDNCPSTRITDWC